MSGFALVGQVMKLLAMSPDHKGKRTFIEKLPSAQKLDGGKMSGIMGKLMGGGGLGDIFKNPMGAILGQVQGLIGQIGSFQAGGGGGGNDENGNPIVTNPAFTDALNLPGGLAHALSELQRHTDNLSGIRTPEPPNIAFDGSASPVSGSIQFGTTDLVMHESFLNTLGEAAPPHLALSVVKAPFYSGDLVSRIASRTYTLNDMLGRGAISDEKAGQEVNAMSAEIRAMIKASYDALAVSDRFAEKAAQVNAVAGAIATGSEELRDTLKTLLQPGIADEMAAALKDRLTIRPPDDEVKEPESQGNTTCV